MAWSVIFFHCFSFSRAFSSTILKSSRFSSNLVSPHESASVLPFSATKLLSICHPSRRLLTCILLTCPLHLVHWPLFTSICSAFGTIPLTPDLFLFRIFYLPSSLHVCSWRFSSRKCCFPHLYLIPTCLRFFPIFPRFPSFNLQDFQISLDLVSLSGSESLLLSPTTKTFPLTCILFTCSIHLLWLL